VSGNEAGGRAAWLPVGDHRFWVVQALIALVFVLHEFDDGRLGVRASTVVPHLAIEALFLFPLLYAAFNFGLRGSLTTAAFVTLLMSIEINLDLPGTGRLDLWAHYVELATLDVMTLVVGRGVESQRLARQRAEGAESHYRQLHDAVPVPILVLDAQGVIHDANPAARAVFGGNVIGRTDRSILPGGFLSREDAGRVLGLPDGRDYRAGMMSLPGDDDTASTQVIFEDITEEHRERRRATLYAALVVQAEEDQRRHLASELHDDPLQLLLHLARRLEMLGGMPGVPTAVVGGLAEARLHALDAAARLASLTRELRPPALDDLGLVPALSSLLLEVQEETDLDTELQVTGEKVRLAPEIELAAFRIIQEAVRNTLRHAEAVRLQVTVEFGPDELGITVADDGRGFAPEKPDDLATEHLGLLGMRERATRLGGHVQMRSSPDTGTVIEARVPLPLRQPEQTPAPTVRKLD